MRAATNTYGTWWHCVVRAGLTNVISRSLFTVSRMLTTCQVYVMTWNEHVTSYIDSLTKDISMLFLRQICVFAGLHNQIIVFQFVRWICMHLFSKTKCIFKYKCTHVYTRDKVHILKVIYHPLYSMNNFVTNKSKLPQDGAQIWGWLAIMWPSQRVTW